MGTRLDDYLSGVLGAVQPGTLMMPGDTRAAGTVLSAYLQGGLAARIVDAPAEDALSRGITVLCDGDAAAEQAMAAEIARLHVPARMTEALRWARLFGGAAVMLFADDEVDPQRPLRLSSLSGIAELRVFDAEEITVDQLYDDPADARCGQPMAYRVTPRGGGTMFTVHETRLLPLPGAPLPHGMSNGLPWRGRSVLSGCLEEVQRYQDALRLSRGMLERKQQAVFGMAGLGELLRQAAMEAADPANSPLLESVRERVRRVDLARNVLNTVVIDAGDQWQVHDLNLSGVSDQIEAFEISIAACTGIPVTHLFGRSAAGQNATGEGDREVYIAVVQAMQRRVLVPPLERLVSLLWQQRGLRASIPESWKLVFPPQWIPSETEQADAALKNAQATLARVQAEVQAETLSGTASKTL
ncbi:putative cytosolic protein [Granulibacter bethesdensis]|uniref:phage portal protein n=1 Tax=Granulibacter bethesdensis TaxID=364410 RepID=UPI00090B7C5B|nr:DUF1073 domain-containing protein [Granulibacter bethesdensis]APH57405.1 putative cytosolic protein [Granulibacter bethesdensis]